MRVLHAPRAPRAACGSHPSDSLDGHAQRDHGHAHARRRRDLDRPAHLAARRSRRTTAVRSSGRRASSSASSRATACRRCRGRATRAQNVAVTTAHSTAIARCVSLSFERQRTLGVVAHRRCPRPMAERAPTQAAPRMTLAVSSQLAQRAHRRTAFAPERAPALPRAATGPTGAMCVARRAAAGDQRESAAPSRDQFAPMPDEL